MTLSYWFSGDTLPMALPNAYQFPFNAGFLCLMLVPLLLHLLTGLWLFHKQDYWFIIFSETCLPLEYSCNLIFCKLRTFISIAPLRFRILSSSDFVGTFLGILWSLSNFYFLGFNLLLVNPSRPWALLEM